MNTETIEIDGYKVIVAKDECPQNPFADWDCNPPTMTYYEGMKSYGDVPDVSDLVGMIPDEKIARHERVDLIGEIHCTLKEFAEGKRYHGETFREAFARELKAQTPEPSGRSWSAATEYFEMIEWLCKLAGVPCHYAQSNGYSQGDSALVMAFATPEWVKDMGIPMSSEYEVQQITKSLEGTCNLYGYWAWGYCYGVSEIIAPDGTELSEGSCWGFYGPNEESGLLDHAKSAIESHKAFVIKEAAEAAEMACRDIARRYRDAVW